MTYPHGVYDFVKYVDSFYGTNDPLYPLIDKNTKDLLTLYDIMRATVNYVEKCLSDLEYAHYVWGDGDSLDRERARVILIDEASGTYHD